MKKINELVDTEYDINIYGISDDSRKIEKGYLFVATKGFNVDHYDYVLDAVQRGAAFLIVDREIDLNFPHIIVENIDDVYKELCIKFYDVDLDLCLLALDETYNFPGLHLASFSVEVGDKIYCIGNTKGEGLCLLDGMVSDINRKIDNHLFFMFNSGISNGNSGGPVLNNRGEVVGIATAGDKKIQNMNYAIPIKTIKLFLDKHNIEI